MQTILSYFVSVLIAIALIRPGIAAEPVTVLSPDKRIAVEFLLLPKDEKTLIPHYRVTFDGKEVIGKSKLGCVLRNGEAIGEGCKMESVDRRTIDDSFVQVTGKRRQVNTRCNEATIQLRDQDTSQRSWQVTLRAFDDAVAFRYRFLPTNGVEHIDVCEESTEFHIADNAKAFALPLNGFKTPYEARYSTLNIGDLKNDSIIGLPLLCSLDQKTWTAITEADVDDYAGLYLTKNSQGGLVSRLARAPADAQLAVSMELPHSSPWRVILLANNPGKFIESDVILSLNKPCAVKDVSWIKSGKSTFPWWNGFYEKKTPFVMGLNTETAKYYIDFCAEAGIPYHSLDGVDNIAWYGGTIVPYEGAEITRGIEGLDLQEVLRYAKEKGIRIRLWMHWLAAEKHMKDAFPLYREWGVEGVMLDFMDRDDQELHGFIHKAVALAAENQLTITLHGCPKPTGLERTYPNLLTHEAVMNLEYDKWDSVGITSEHELTVPFTRMLAGPLDFHQGSFRTVRPQDFQPRNEAPLVMGTPARTLASYVVYENHLSMVADYPSAYRGHPGLAALSDVPTTWDDIKFIDGKVAEYIVIGRKSGETWYIGAMTDASKRTLEFPISAMGTLSDYTAEGYFDNARDEHGLDFRKMELRRDGKIKIDLEPHGGCFIRLVPTKP